jgi:hypothetical protein
VYLDNILIFSKLREEHVRYVSAVLERLRRFALYGNLKKCSFFQERIAFLGFVVTTSSVEIDPSRIDAVESWPTLRSYADIQQFLGFANFYRRFIKNYSKIIKPLIDQLKGMQRGRKQG